MSVVVRFAPSPTGYIHIGNLRTALFNWLLRCKMGGEFILRFDDTDVARSKTEYAEAILEDLAWVGIEPDRIEYQSKRSTRYDQIAQELKDKGLLYGCYEASDELDRKRKRLRARGLPPVYDRAGYQLSEDDKKSLEESGRKAHWRFLLPNFETDPLQINRVDVEWNDLCREHQVVDLASLSDPVLIREDATYLYTLPSIIDDIDMGVTHVIRGEDHVANTGVQIAIFKALGGAVPEFAHHNLLVGRDGSGISKRQDSLSIRELRNSGFEPNAVAAIATLIGTSHPVEPIDSLSDLAKVFEFKSISRTPAKFDTVELEHLNKRCLHELAYDKAKSRLQQVSADSGEAFWEIARQNLDKFKDVVVWSEVINGEIKFENKSEDLEFLARAAELLPNEPWDETTWGAWTNEVKRDTGRKGRELFMPLRIALTGMEHGPELKRLLPLIGNEKSLQRLTKV